MNIVLPFSSLSLAHRTLKKFQDVEAKIHLALVEGKELFKAVAAAYWWAEIDDLTVIYSKKKRWEFSVWCPPESSNQQKILREFQFCITLGNICIWHHLRPAHQWKRFRVSHVTFEVYKNSSQNIQREFSNNFSCSRRKHAEEDDCRTIIMSNMKEDRERAKMHNCKCFFGECSWSLWLGVKIEQRQIKKQWFHMRSA